MERDEHIFEYVMDELDNGVRNEALWIKAYAMVGGRDEKIKPRYMQYRVEEIKDNFIENHINYKEFTRDELYESIEKDFAPMWMLNLWRWADEYEVLEYGNHIFIEFANKGYESLDCGLPRDKTTLLSMSTLRIGQNPGSLLQNESMLADTSKMFNILSYNTFTFLPKEIGNLTNLTELYIEYNRLTELPKEIGNLTNLTKLGLAGNRLSELPGELINLIDLELDLKNNQLTELPKEIGNLTNLTKLDLTSNRLSELPKEIGQLVNLIELGLENNQLTELPKEIGNLTNLRELYIEYNRLIELPKEIENLSNLTYFELLGMNLVLTKDQILWIEKL